jgi:hypothetical protein
VTGQLRLLGLVPEHYKLCFCGVTGSEMAKRILIVEDGGDLRAIVAAVLTRVGGYATIPPLKDFLALIVDGKTLARVYCCTSPLACDSERETRRLNVDKKRATVRREDRAGKLRIVHCILGKLKKRAILRNADDMVLLGVILAHI